MMSILGLSAASLKREEFYTFLGGLFVALSWFVGFGISKSSAPSAGITLADTATFVLMWLSCTLAVYVLLIVLYQFVPARAKKKVDGMDIPKTKEWLHLHESPLYYLNKSVVDDSKLGSHVLGVAVVAMPLSAYPLSHIALAATTLSACPAPAWAIVFFAVLCLLSSAAWVYLINRF